MERNEIIDILNGMCERCLMKGILPTLMEAKTLCDTFDRFRKISYVDDEEYSRDIFYFYNLATRLHESGHTSLEESYSIYNAILAADSIDFVKPADNVESIITVEPITLTEHVDETVVKNKRSKKTKEKSDGVIEASDIIA
jgi:hypothetical protein